MSAASIQYWGFDARQVMLTLFCVVFGVMSVSSIVPFAMVGYHVTLLRALKPNKEYKNSDVYPKP